MKKTTTLGDYSRTTRWGCPKSTFFGFIAAPGRGAAISKMPPVVSRTRCALLFGQPQHQSSPELRKSYKMMV